MKSDEDTRESKLEQFALSTLAGAGGALIAEAVKAIILAILKQ